MEREEEGVSSIDALLRPKSPLGEEYSSQEEGMNVSPSIEDRDPWALIENEMTSILEEKVGDDNADTSKAHQELHEEKDGALAPREETLALLQGVPQDLMHEEHVLSLINDELLEIEEEEGNHKVESMNLSLFHLDPFMKARRSM